MSWPPIANQALKECPLQLPEAGVTMSSRLRAVQVNAISTAWGAQCNLVALGCGDRSCQGACFPVAATHY